MTVCKYCRGTGFADQGGGHHFGECIPCVGIGVSDELLSAVIENLQSMNAEEIVEVEHDPTITIPFLRTNGGLGDSKSKMVFDLEGKLGIEIVSGNIPKI